MARWALAVNSRHGSIGRNQEETPMRRATIALIAALSAIAAGTARAEPVRIGVSRLASCAPIAIAIAKGYFAAEQLEPQLSYFDAQQPIAVGVTSGDLDFGIAAETAALYSLAGDGKLRVIGGGASEAPTFHYLGILVSNQAYDAGLKSPRDIGGHSFALTQRGTGLEYSLGQLAEKFGFDYKSVKLMPLQGNANIASALAGGRTDSAIFSATGALPLVEKGDAKLLGWIGDETGLDQAYLFFTQKEIADGKGATVERVLRALRKGARDYHDAFTDKSGRRNDEASAPEMLDIIAKYISQPVQRVKLGLPYFDADLRVDVKDVQRQIDWYRAQGLLKTEVNAAQILDKRYVVPLPAK
jgi:NitT/TauT family transport system substrate-binding protein